MRKQGRLLTYINNFVRNIKEFKNISNDYDIIELNSCYGKNTINQ